MFAQYLNLEATQMQVHTFCLPDVINEVNPQGFKVTLQSLKSFFIFYCSFMNKLSLFADEHAIEEATLIHFM